MKSPWKYFLKILSIVIVIIISTITLSACGNANFVDKGGEQSPETPTPSTPTITTYTITLDRQGGTGGSSSVQTEYNKPMPTASMPTRVNYTFLGYYSATSGGTQYYASNMASLRSWDKHSSGTLYARWDSNYTTVTLTKYNYTQYFTVTGKWVLDKPIIDNNYAQAHAEWTVGLKAGVSVSSNSTASFFFLTTSHASAYAGVSFSSYSFMSNQTGKSSTTSVYYGSSGFPSLTTIPNTVSGTLYIPK